MKGARRATRWLELVRRRSGCAVIVAGLAVSGCSGDGGAGGAGASHDDGGGTIADTTADAGVGDVLQKDATEADVQATDTRTPQPDAEGPDSVSTDAVSTDAAATDGGTTDGATTDTSVPIGPNQCSTEVACTNQGTCAPPGTPTGCGMCRKPPNPCKDDSECPAQGAKPGICEHRKQDCTCSGEKLCHAGCADDSDCKTGEACDGAGRCKPASCGASTPCPTFFTCTGGSCTRTPCKASSTCNGGVCVLGACYAEPGKCLLPVP